jgi:hypothetical protein
MNNDYKDLVNYINELHSVGALEYNVYSNLMFLVQQLEPNLRFWGTYNGIPPDGLYVVFDDDPMYPDRAGRIIDGVFRQGTGNTLLVEEFLKAGGAFYGPIPEIFKMGEEGTER